MDRRGWPWRKKSSDKSSSVTDSAAAPVANSSKNHGDEDTSKKVNYVKIPEETYNQLTEAEEQVKVLNEKLASTVSEVTTKENLVKQHAKVAEEAVSGWEKAEAEALALKQQLELLTLEKLTSDDRAAHLDGALKECMRQIRQVKEDNEQKLYEIITTKTRQWEKIKSELEARIVGLEQELLRASAENNALTRSLQEHSGMLMKINEEKAQAEAEIKVLQVNIQSYEREINSLKYELNIVAKELEIRNEEKNMGLRSAEVANKQHLEGVKKIAKLEAECQRLRGLVRKKLPGPAALAQMKLEVDNLGRDYGESRLKRSPVKNSSPHLAPITEFALDHAQHGHKETEFLTARLLAMEEETKMLKEALSKRNSELQAARNVCAKTASKLQSMEAQVQALNHKKNPMNTEVSMEGSMSQNTSSNPPSLASMSEDGIDDETSCAESWASALISELSQFKREKDMDKGNKELQIELMDDFLEMEKLASTQVTSVEKELQTETDQNNPKPDTNDWSLSQLRERIAMIFESRANGTGMEKILENIRCVLKEFQNNLPRHNSGGLSDGSLSTDAASQTIGETLENGNCPPLCDSKPCTRTLESEFTDAISKIQTFVESLSKEASRIWKERLDIVNGLSKSIEDFSISVNEVLSGRMDVKEFIFDLSHVMAEAGVFFFEMLNKISFKGERNDVAAGKLGSKEDKVAEMGLSGERCLSDSTLSSQSCLGSGALQEKMVDKLHKHLEGEIEQLKSEKDIMARDFVMCNENLEHTKAQLVETEQLLSELKLELESCQNSKSLVETQLKCMAESYRTLELRAKEVEDEVKLLRENAEALNSELQEEKRICEEAVTKCMDLQEQIQRNEECAVCSSCPTDQYVKAKQEKEIAAAAEKLAECQETIFLLGRQLKALRSSPNELTGSPFSENEHHSQNVMEQDSVDLTQVAMEDTPSDVPRIEFVSRLDPYTIPQFSSDTEASPLSRSPINPKRPKHRPTRSSSSSSSSVPTPEKNTRGFSRFFSRGKVNH